MVDFHLYLYISSSISILYLQLELRLMQVLVVLLASLKYVIRVIIVRSFIIGGLLEGEITRLFVLLVDCSRLMVVFQSPYLLVLCFALEVRYLHLGRICFSRLIQVKAVCHQTHDFPIVFHDFLLFYHDSPIISQEILLLLFQHFNE